MKIIYCMTLKKGNFRKGFYFKFNMNHDDDDDDARWKESTSAYPNHVSLTSPHPFFFIDFFHKTNSRLVLTSRAMRASNATTYKVFM